MALDDSRGDFGAAKRHLAASIRADLFSGAANLANLRQDARESLRIAVGTTNDAPRMGKGVPTPIGRILAAGGALPLFPDPLPEPRRPLSPAESIAERIARLEALELELYRLLATTAPNHWQEVRRPLTQLLRRSRRALRAIQRSGAGGQ